MRSTTKLVILTERERTLRAAREAVLATFDRTESRRRVDERIRQRLGELPSRGLLRVFTFERIGR